MELYNFTSIDKGYLFTGPKLHCKSNFYKHIIEAKNCIEKMKLYIFFYEISSETQI